MINFFINIDLINSVLIFIAAVYFIFGLSLFFKGGNKKSSTAYLWVVLFTVFWTISMIMYRAGINDQLLLFWCKILYSVAIFVSSSFFVFTTIFPHERIAWHKINIVFILSCLMTLLVSFTSFVIVDVKQVLGGENIIIWGNLYFLYFIFVSGVISAGLINLFKNFLKESGIKKVQIKYIFIGYSIGTSLAMVTNLLMPWMGYFYLNWFGQIAVLVIVVFTVYTIITHNLMDIKLTLRKSLVIFLSLSTVFAIVVSLKFIIYRYIPDVFPVRFMIDFAVFFTVVVNFSKIRSYFFRFANKYFFATLYDSGALSSKINDIVYSSMDPEKVYRGIDRALEKTFYMKSFGVLYYNKKTKKYKIKYNSNILLGRKKVFELDESLIRQNKPIILNYFKSSSKKQKISLEELKKYKIEVIVPLKTEKEIIGVLFFGQKETNELYNTDDMKVLKVISSQIVLSSESMKYYEAAKSYKKILKKRIEDKRGKIEISNRELRELDKTKSEFVSIVSHQLRTPLTVIKGYTSMILEGSFGDVKKAKKLALNKVLNSSERLIQMVENLLYLSRIESKKLSFNLDEYNFEHLVENVVNRYKNVINGEELCLIYKKSRKKIGDISMDEEKIRLVIVNLIENAIKYTKGNKIIISTKVKDKKAMFYISNTGPLISKSKINHIFNKFTGDKSEMGIGLYISKKIIDGHNGELVVQNLDDGTGVEGWFVI